ncbi:MAG: phosphoribosyl-AMP cyclohydrolase [Isosphaeraceae bacterium]
MTRPDETVADAPTAPDGPDLFATIRWTADGLVPAIVQDADSNEVLMMAWMNEAALRRTLETGQTHFYSRSRRSAWHKGETSGHVQNVVSVHVDCDADVVLIRAHQVGGACHEGYRSCFSRRVGTDLRLEPVGVRVFETAAVYGSARSHAGSSSVE